MTGSEDASWQRETTDERDILRFRTDDVDARVLDLRRERDSAALEYEIQLDELRREVERIENMRDQMILRYDYRIGDVIDHAPAAE